MIFYPDYQQPSQSTKETWMASSSNSTLHQVVAKSSSFYSALSNEFSCNSTIDDVPLDLAMDNMCLIKKKMRHLDHLVAYYQTIGGDLTALYQIRQLLLHVVLVL